MESNDYFAIDSIFQHKSLLCVNLKSCKSCKSRRQFFRPLSVYYVIDNVTSSCEGSCGKKSGFHRIQKPSRPVLALLHLICATTWISKFHKTLDVGPLITYQANTLTAWLWSLNANSHSP